MAYSKHDFERPGSEEHKGASWGTEIQQFYHSVLRVGDTDKL